MSPAQALRVLGFGFLAAVISCSSSRRDSIQELAPREGVAIERVYAGSIFVRRPSFRPANPRAEALDEDFATANPVEPNWGCKRVQELEALHFPGSNTGPLRACLTQLHQAIRETPLEVVYTLDTNDGQPALELDPEDKEVPDCLRATLSKILVPREIFVLAPDVDDRPMPGQLPGPACYAARITTERKRIVGMDLGQINKFELKLVFPLSFLPKNDDETRRMLRSWILTAFFFEREPRQLWAKWVPWSICEQCFGEKRLRDLMKKSLEPVWPGAWPRPNASPSPSPTPSPSPGASPSPTPTPSPNLYFKGPKSEVETTEPPKVQQ